MQRVLILALCLYGILATIAIILLLIRGSHRNDVDSHSASDEEIIQHLVKTLSLQHGRLGQGGYTPASVTLTRFGPKGLSYVLPALIDNDDERRMIAEQVFRDVTADYFNISMNGAGFSGPRVAQWKLHWRAMGEYRFDSAPGDRKASHDKWKVWLAEMEKQGWPRPYIEEGNDDVLPTKTSP